MGAFKERNTEREVDPCGERQHAKQPTRAQQPKSSEKAQTRFFTVWAIIGAIGLLLGFCYLLTLIPVPVGIAIWSVIIIFCLRTPVNFFESHGVNRVIATVLAYVIMLVVIVLVGILLFSPVFGFGEQFTNLIQSIPGYIQAITQWANDVYAQYGDILQNDTVMQALNQAMASMGEAASELASQSAGGIVSVGTSVANSFLAIGFAFVVAFWILMDLPGIGKEIYRIADEKYHDDLKMLHLSFTRVMGGYIKATLFQCTVIGVLCGILFAIIGIPNSVAFGVITGLLNIIPIVGPWLGGALAAIVGVFIDPLIGLVALVGTICLQQFVYTFISPKIMQDSVDVHPAITLVIMMIGSALGGIMAGLIGSLVGMLFSIPLVAVAKAIFVYYFEKKSGRRIVSEDGVFFKASPASGDEFNPMADATSSYKLAAAKGPRVPSPRHSEHAGNGGREQGGTSSTSAESPYDRGDRVQPLNGGASDCAASSAADSVQERKE